MPDLPPGTNRCQCGSCGEAFSTVGNFDRQQTINRKTGDVTCYHPAERGLVLRDGWWAGAAMPLAVATARQSATKDPAPESYQGGTR